MPEPLPECRPTACAPGVWGFDNQPAQVTWPCCPEHQNFVLRPWLRTPGEFLWRILPPHEALKCQVCCFCWYVFVGICLVKFQHCCIFPCWQNRIPKFFGRRHVHFFQAVWIRAVVQTFAHWQRNVQANPNLVWLRNCQKRICSKTFHRWGTERAWYKLFANPGCDDISNLSTMFQGCFRVGYYARRQFVPLEQRRTHFRPLMYSEISKEFLIFSNSSDSTSTFTLVNGFLGSSLVGKEDQKCSGGFT